MTPTPFHVGDFVWCAFPESEHPARPSHHLHVVYILVITRPISAATVSEFSASPGPTCLVAYTTSQPLRHAAGRPGVIPFSAEQAAGLGQQRAFWLHLWRVAHLPMTPTWFPRLPDPGNGVVGSVSVPMRRELDAKAKDVFRRHRLETEQLGPLRPRQ
jgi:hypothetical protein